MILLAQSIDAIALAVIGAWGLFAALAITRLAIGFGGRLSGAELVYTVLFATVGVIAAYSAWFVSPLSMSIR
jgi:hypothetical protein